MSSSVVLTCIRLLVASLFPAPASHIMVSPAQSKLASVRAMQMFDPTEIKASDMTAADEKKMHEREDEL